MRHIRSTCGLALLLLLDGCLDVAAGHPCTGNCEESNWRVGEVRLGPHALPPAPRSAADLAFMVTAPTGVGRTRLALAARTSLDIGAETTILPSTGELGGDMAVAALREVVVGDGVQLASVYSGSNQPLVLPERVRVNGFVRAGGEVSTHPSASIASGVLTGVVDPGESHAWVVGVEPSGAALESAPESSPLHVAPGSYRHLRVASGGRAVLEAGHYHFEALEVMEGGTLELDQNRGRIHVWVRYQLTMAGAMQPRGSTARLLVGYAGTETPRISGPFSGTLVAPKATLELPSTDAPHAGAFFADRIRVAPNTTIQHVPYDLL